MRNRRSLWITIGGAGLALLLAAAACGGNGADEGSPEDASSEPDAEIAMISGARFDRAEIVVPVGQDVTIRADNQDGSIPHNFSIYTSADSYASGERAIASTEICAAPCVRSLTVDLEPGSYFFLCDVHPLMRGSVIAES